jgi:hypothetical protein
VEPGSKKAEVNASESILAFRCIKHNNSYKSTDCNSNFTEKVFPGSDTARSVTSARTKTEANISGMISSHAIDTVKVSMADISFCGVATDASNHLVLKIIPGFIQYFDWGKGGLHTKLVDIQSTRNETAHAIARYFHEILQNNYFFQSLLHFQAKIVCFK